MTIRVPSDLAGLVEIRKVDGVDCLVVRPDGRIRLDGIPVKTDGEVAQ